MPGAKLLLVDEEDARAQGLAKNLSQRNVSVSVAATADEALAQLDREPFIDVTLLALKASEGAGMETLRRIKQNHPLVEVIVLTGVDGVHAAIEGMKLGAFDYAVQPCDMEELISKIEAAKQKKRAHQEEILRAARQELLRRRSL
jgi:DNA-binding NtrC family response regulator